MFPGILSWFQKTWADGARQIAMFHTFVNVGATLLLLPFVNQLSKLLYVILPKQADEAISSGDSSYKSLELFPETTFVRAREELVKMSRITLDNLRLALEAFYLADVEKAAVVLATESKIDHLEKKITSWLSGIQHMTTPEEVETLRSMLYAVSDMERIGDHAENIAEYASHKGIRRKDMHSEARDSLHELSNKVLEIVEMTIDLFDNYSVEAVEEIEKIEEIIDDLAKECIDKYIQRQESKVRDPRGGIVLTGIVGDLERSADHAVNIAKNMKHYHDVIN